MERGGTGARGTASIIEATKLVEKGNEDNHEYDHRWEGHQNAT